MIIPTHDEIKSLHKKYAPDDETFKGIWQHCQIVREVALWCLDNANLTKANRELIEAGCLLHDLGIYTLRRKEGELDESYIRHGILGYDLLKKEGLSEELCRFASHHTGVGITSLEIKMNKLPLPAEDYLAETLEERIVMYADKFHSKHDWKFNSIAWYKQYLASRFGREKVRLFENMVSEFGEPPVNELAKKYGQEIR